MKLFAHGIRMAKVALIVKFLQKSTNLRPYREYLAELDTYPRGTVGREVSAFMRENDYDFIPGFTEHDMKHVLLGYGITSEEELRMQAFMMGNGNYSPLCVLFVFSAITIPRLWNTLVQDFRAGRKCVSIVNWKLEDVAHMPLGRLQHMMFTGMPMNPGRLNVRR